MGNEPNNCEHCARPTTAIGVFKITRQDYELGEVEEKLFLCQFHKTRVEHTVGVLKVEGEI